MEKRLFPINYTIGWNGKIFERKTLGIDTETVLIQSKSHSPRMVLAGVSDGETNLILRPSEVDAFLAAHSDHVFVAHNAAFDFWVLSEHTHRMWNIVESNRLHDTMYLDMLIRLATGLGEARIGSDEGKLFPQGLGKLCTQHAKDLQLSYDVDKESPYRLRFGELLLEEDWSKVDSGFFEYAAADPYATVRLHNILYPQALRLAKTFQIPEEKTREYGPLTHHLQVRASIALLNLTRNGICFDPQKTKELEQKVREGIQNDIADLDSAYPKLFQRYSARMGGGLKFTEKSNTPSMSTKVLRELLSSVCKENNIQPPLSEGKTQGLVSIAASDWEPHKEKNPLIKKFLNLNGTAKLLSFFNIFEESTTGRIHPSYQVLMRTGRTSSSKPNIQQIPGDKAFRSLFVPRPGKMFAVIDYAFIELRTLAAICEERFGSSVLADTIRNNIDPHVYTAAMIQGLTLEEFKALKETNPAAFKAARQAAKALNFGIPGGLGAASLADYAKASYGVEMHKEQAAAFRKKLIYQIYPEIGKYLSDSILEDLSHNLGIPPELVEGPLKKISPISSSAAVILSNTVRLKNRSDYRYSPTIWDTCWRAMQDLLDLSTKDFSHLRENCKHQTGGMDFHYELFATTAITMTGRVRGACTYTQARNTPFQSLAADGAKRALWRLVREKFHVVAFVHDEIVLEVDSSEEALKAKEIMESEMHAAMDARVPVECSMAISPVWEK
jgi:hypothetical protein